MHPTHPDETQVHKAYLWTICLVATLGGFLFGYDWVVVGGAKEFYEAHFGIYGEGMELAKGWGTSSALIGCIIGAVGCSFVSDRFGRKRLLILAGLLFAISAVGTGLAETFSQYNSFRIIGGLGMGIALNVSPLYISEMSPSRMRGMMVSVNQLSIMLGVLCAQIVNWRISLIDTAMPVDATPEIIAGSWNGLTGWRWMFGAEAVPAVLFFVLMFFVPESARWLMKKGRHEEARGVFEKLGGKAYADAEVADVASTLPKEEIGVVRFSDLIERHVLKVLLLGVFLSFLQQWCGMNAVFYYAADIFKAAGYNLKAMMLNIVVIGSVMVVSVFITMALVDRVGRKSLLLFGCGVLAAVYIAIGICFHTGVQGLPVVLLTLICVSVYSFTLAPLLWVILSEIYPNRIRGAAISIAATAHWVANFTLTYTFPTVNKQLGMSGVFWLFAGVCIVGFLVVRRVLPETKGRTLEDIERDLYGEVVSKD
ncbi:MFS transporter [Coraliomargarita sinensis]|uniref:MFS transporter n=2 Tax=Coraliomargarita sinensis TaxID=2174842 RepID=A0A317ZLN5_9BACT|nr:MFS transporter [Coraliomargarita sinensis]